MGISPTQLLIILVIVALIFGTKKLRNIGSDLGGAVKSFKKSMSDEAPPDNTSVHDDVLNELIEAKVEVNTTESNTPSHKTS